MGKIFKFVSMEYKRLFYFYEFMLMFYKGYSLIYKIEILLLENEQ